MMLNYIISLLVISLLIESLTSIAVHSLIFFPVRKYIVERSVFFGELVTCGYCFSLWVALIICLIAFFTGTLPIVLEIELFNFIVLWLISHRLSNVWHGSIDRYFDTRKDIRYNRD